MSGIELFRIEDVALSSEGCRWDFSGICMADQAQEFYHGFAAQGSPILFVAKIGFAPFFVIFAETTIISHKIGIDAANEEGGQDSLDRIGAEQEKSGREFIAIDLRE
jgi:hypothetical protein